MEEMKKKIILIAVTAILLVGAIWVEKNSNLATWQLLIVYLIPYLIIGHETLMEAAEGIAHGEVFDEDFLMAIATIGALCIGFFPDSETEFPEAVFVMLFFQVGELFEGYAEGKSRDSISHLMDIRPDVANVERKSLVETVSPEEVKVGEVIVVRPGEKVPLDGVVVEGSSALNTLALTGESVPRDLNEGDEVVSGCINLTGVIRVRRTSVRAPFPRLSPWWRAPMKTSRRVRLSSLALPVSIRLSWFSPPWLWLLSHHSWELVA